MSEPQRTEEEILQEQMQHLLQYVETSQSEPVIQSVFGRLGHECYHVRNLDAWLGPYVGNVQAFLDWVNVQQGSKYWERLEFSADGKTLFLTGRKVQACACRFANCAQPPRSLCRYCCKQFQEEIFGKLLGQKVDVEITAAFLRGDERCSTTIHRVG